MIAGNAREQALALWPGEISDADFARWQQRHRQFSIPKRARSQARVRRANPIVVAGERSQVHRGDIARLDFQMVIGLGHQCSEQCFRILLEASSDLLFGDRAQEKICCQPLEREQGDQTGKQAEAELGLQRSHTWRSFRSNT